MGGRGVMGGTNKTLRKSNNSDGCFIYWTTETRSSTLAGKGLLFVAQERSGRITPKRFL